MNNNSLEQTFTNTADAIRAKLHTQSGISPDNFASEIAKISGGDTDIYHVSTLTERDNLNAEENDICLVHSIQEQNISENSVFNTFTFKNSFTIDTAFQDYISVMFRDEEYTCSVRMDYYDNNLNIDVFAEIDGDYEEARINYISQDGLTFSLDSATGDLIDGNKVDLPVYVSYEDYGETIDQNIFKFGTIKELYFPGIYKYDGTNWNYLDIGINTTSDNVYQGNSIYTSEGITSGTLPNKVNLYNNISVGTQAPTSAGTENDIYVQTSNISDYSSVIITENTDSYNTPITSDCTIPSVNNYTRDFVDEDGIYWYQFGGDDYKLDLFNSSPAVKFSSGSGDSRGIIKIGNYIYFMHGGSNVYKYTISTGTTTRLNISVNITYGAGMFYFRKNNQLIIVGLSGSSSNYNIYRLDLSTDSIISTSTFAYPARFSISNIVYLDDTNALCCSPSAGNDGLNGNIGYILNLETFEVISTINNVRFGTEVNTILGNNLYCVRGHMIQVYEVNNNNNTYSFSHLGGALIKAPNDNTGMYTTVFIKDNYIYFTKNDSNASAINYKIDLSNLKLYLPNKDMYDLKQALILEIGNKADIVFTKKLDNSVYNGLRIENIKYIPYSGSIYTYRPVLADKIYEYRNNSWNIIIDNIEEEN